MKIIRCKKKLIYVLRYAGNTTKMGFTFVQMQNKRLR